MAIWWRAPVLVWIARVPDEALDIGTATPARTLRPFCTRFEGMAGYSQSDPAMRRRTGR
jgi:hypothetical protein